MNANWDVSGLHDRADRDSEPEIDWEPRKKRRRFGWPRGRRSRVGLIAGIVSLGVVGAFIWSGRDRADHEYAGETPTIRADETPIKIPPESPGGMEVPHRDKLVYQRLPGGEPGKLERLLPPPEEPLPAPVAERAAQPEAAAPSGFTQPGQRERLSEDAGTETSSIFTQVPDQPAPRPDASAPSQPAPKLAQPANPQPIRQPGTGPRPLTPQPPAQASTAQPPPKTAMVTPPPTPPQVPSQGSAAGGYSVQLVAVSSAGQAQGVWTSLRNRNSDLLGGLTPTFVRADLGAKGSIYRLRAGPIVSEERARAVCAELVKRNVDCIIVRPSG